MRRLVSIAVGTVFTLFLASGTEAQTSKPSLASLKATGLEIKTSPYTVQETSDRLTQVLSAKGLNIFATIDHRQNAVNAGLELPATKVIVFGNPKLGTPLMQCSQTVGLDLPQKILIWQDEQTVRLAYNNPAFISGRHRLRGCGQQVLDKISKALNGITNQVVKAN